MDDPVTVDTFAAQLTLWMSSAGHLTDTQLATKAGISADVVRRARKADPGVRIEDWVAIWRVMGVLEEVAQHTMPMAAVAQEVGRRALSQAQDRQRN